MASSLARSSGLNLSESLQWAINRQTNLSSRSSYQLYRQHCQSLPFAGTPKFLFQPANGPYLDIDMDAPNPCSASDDFVVLNSDSDNNARLLSTRRFLTPVPTGSLAPPPLSTPPRPPKPTLMTSFRTNPLTAMDVDEPLDTTCQDKTSVINALVLYRLVYDDIVKRLNALGTHSHLQTVHTSATWEAISHPETVAIIAKSLRLGEHTYIIKADRSIEKVDDPSVRQLCCAFFGLLEVSAALAPSLTYLWLDHMLFSITSGTICMCEKLEALPRLSKSKRNQADGTDHLTDSPKPLKYTPTTPPPNAATNPVCHAWNKRDLWKPAQWVTPAANTTIGWTVRAQAYSLRQVRPLSRPTECVYIPPSMATQVHISKANIMAYLYDTFNPNELVRKKMHDAETLIDAPQRPRIYNMDENSQNNGNALEFIGDSVLNLSVVIMVEESLQDYLSSPEILARPVVGKTLLEILTLSLSSNKCIGLVGWKLGYANSITVSPSSAAKYLQFINDPKGAVAGLKPLADHMEARLGAISLTNNYRHMADLVTPLMQDILPAAYADYQSVAYKEHLRTVQIVEDNWHEAPKDLGAYHFKAYLERLGVPTTPDVQLDDQTPTQNNAEMYFRHLSSEAVRREFFQIDSSMFDFFKIVLYEFAKYPKVTISPKGEIQDKLVMHNVSTGDFASILGRDNEEDISAELLRRSGATRGGRDCGHEDAREDSGSSALCAWRVLVGS
ncbi:hypothetical protein ONZ45_g16192 [Pleurotus djamor]|nr:hypothetical protein ONZ45_g16192 [Pleurotus djamor]